MRQFTGRGHGQSQDCRLIVHHQRRNRNAEGCRTQCGVTGSQGCVRLRTVHNRDARVATRHRSRNICRGERRAVISQINRQVNDLRRIDVAVGIARRTTSVVIIN